MRQLFNGRHSVPNLLLMWIGTIRGLCLSESTQLAIGGSFPNPWKWNSTNHNLWLQISIQSDASHQIISCFCPSCLRFCWCWPRSFGITSPVPRNTTTTTDGFSTLAYAIRKVRIENSRTRKGNILGLHPNHLSRPQQQPYVQHLCIIRDMRRAPALEQCKIRGVVNKDRA